MKSAPVTALMLFLKVAVFDMLTGAFFVFTLALVLTALPGHALDLRWIDVVPQSPQFIYDRYFTTAGGAPQPRAPSEAELIEWQIAERERRLRELGAGGMTNYANADAMRLRKIVPSGFEVGALGLLGARESQAPDIHDLCQD